MQMVDILEPRSGPSGTLHALDFGVHGSVVHSQVVDIVDSVIHGMVSFRIM